MVPSDRWYEVHLTGKLAACTTVLKPLRVGWSGADRETGLLSFEGALATVEGRQRATADRRGSPM